VTAPCALVGLVTVPRVNVMGWPPVNVPVLSDTVSTGGEPAMLAVPEAPAAGAVNVSAVFAVHANPAPLSVMMILPVLATVVTGVRVTDIVTPAKPLSGLLSVTAGWLVPRLSTMATKVPVVLAPTTVVPSLAVVAALTTVMPP